MGPVLLILHGYLKFHVFNKEFTEPLSYESEVSIYTRLLMMLWSFLHSLSETRLKIQKSTHTCTCTTSRAIAIVKYFIMFCQLHNLFIVYLQRIPYLKWP